MIVVHSGKMHVLLSFSPWLVSVTNSALNEFSGLITLFTPPSCRKGRVYLINLRFLKISFFDLMNALPLVLGWEKVLA